jgi:chromosome segregation ATPase
VGSASTTPWTRFYDEVVVNDAWPRELWSLAVGDALARHLSGSSPLLTSFRRETDELVTLAGRGPTTYREERRLGELETELRQLAAQADHEIREAKRSSAAGAAGSARARRQRLERVAPQAPGLGAASVAGAVLVAGGLIGAGVVATLYVYDLRLQREVQLALEPERAAVQELIADAEERLDERIAEAGAERATAAAIRRDLAADAASLREKINASLAEMTALREEAAVDVDQLLARRSADVEQVLDRWKLRGDALGRGLDEVSADLANLEARLPDVRQSLVQLGARVDEGRAGYQALEAELASLRESTAGIGAKAEAERTALEGQIEDRQRALAGLDEQIAALEGAIASSRERVEQLEQGLQDTLVTAEARAERLQTVATQADDAGAKMAALLEQGERDAARLQADVSSDLDAILSETAEKADRAVLRSEDVLRRGENQALRQIGTGGQEAVQAIEAARQNQLARLSDEVEATRVEIEQTRAGLIASWQRMDALVAERYDEFLTDLDDHTATLDAQLRALEDAAAVQRVSTEDQQ